MHRFMLDYESATLFEGIWFTDGPVAICGGDPAVIRTFADMDELRSVYASALELRWLDNMDEYWDERDFAVRSAHYDWTCHDLSYTLPAPPRRN